MKHPAARLCYKTSTRPWCLFLIEAEMFLLHRLLSTLNRHGTGVAAMSPLWGSEAPVFQASPTAYSSFPFRSLTTPDWPHPACSLPSQRPAPDVPPCKKIRQGRRNASCETLEPQIWLNRQVGPQAPTLEHDGLVLISELYPWRLSSW